MKSALIRNGQHQRPLLAVVKRYGIGSPDKYDRGIWISQNDIPAIEAGMQSDPSAFLFGGRLLVKGTNIHNHVELADFVSLFE